MRANEWPFLLVLWYDKTHGPVLARQCSMASFVRQFEEMYHRLPSPTAVLQIDEETFEIFEGFGCTIFEE